MISLNMLQCDHRPEGLLLQFDFKIKSELYFSVCVGGQRERGGGSTRKGEEATRKVGRFRLNRSSRSESMHY